MWDPVIIFVGDLLEATLKERRTLRYMYMYTNYKLDTGFEEHNKLAPGTYSCAITEDGSF